MDGQKKLGMAICNVGFDSDAASRGLQFGIKQSKDRIQGG